MQHEAQYEQRIKGRADIYAHFSAVWLRWIERARFSHLERQNNVVSDKDNIRQDVEDVVDLEK